MSCNDIPSLLDLQKAKLNADDFGRLMGTGTGTSTNGVTGQVRPTYNKVIADMNSEFDAQILNMGFTRIGTFSAGATITNPRQTLLWDVADGGDGQEYGWSGSFPLSGKVVPPGSTPLTTGGIAVGAWMSRFDPALRVQVRGTLRSSYAEAGYNLVDGSFDAGGTVTSATDVLLYETTGIAYLWLGVLPKVVPAGSTPASTGGVGLGSWAVAHSNVEERLLGVGAKIYRGSNWQYVQNGDAVPVGTTHLRVLINGKVEDLVAWDELTLPATISAVIPTTDNGFAGYDLVTDQGTFEFVTIDIYKLRKNGDVLGWGWDGTKTAPYKIYQKIVSGEYFKAPKCIQTLHGIAAKWQAGLKSPIVIFGDSTTDGRTTTLDGTTTATVYNTSRLVSDKVPDGLIYDHDDSEQPNAYPNQLQRMANEFFNNSILRVYNAGYRGKQIQNGWATDNVYNAVYGNTTYADCEMICINFGLNDSNYASSETLRINTYNYTKALILDAFARGVQPFLMTCNLAFKTNDTSDYGENEEVSLIIDNVKRQLASEFSLELIDMNKAIIDFIYDNNDGYGFTDLSDDDLHLGDIGHNFQAGFILKTLAGDMIPNVSDSIVSVDAGRPAMRTPVSSDKFSASDPLRGANKQFVNISLTGAQISNYLDTNIYDLFVWNTGKNTAFVYKASTFPILNVGSIADFDNTPRLIAESKLFTVNDYHKEVLFNETLPDITYIEVTQIEQPYVVCKLKYGLNRIRLSIPASLDSGITSVPTIYLGWFQLVPNCIDFVRPVVTYNAIDDMDYPAFKDALAGRGSMHQFNKGSGTTRYTLPLPMLDNMQNTISANKVGDYWEVATSWGCSNATGVIISWKLKENSQDDTTYDKKNYYRIGECLVLYYRNGDLRVAYLPNDVSANILGTYTVTATTIANTRLTVRLTRTSETVLTLQVFDESHTELINVTADYATDKSTYSKLALFLCGVAGGSWMDELVQSSVNKIDYIQCRSYRGLPE